MYGRQKQPFLCRFKKMVVKFGHKFRSAYQRIPISRIDFYNVNYQTYVCMLIRNYVFYDLKKYIYISRTSCIFMDNVYEAKNVNFRFVDHESCL